MVCAQSADDGSELRKNALRQHVTDDMIDKNIEQIHMLITAEMVM